MATCVLVWREEKQVQGQIKWGGSCLSDPELYSRYNELQGHMLFVFLTVVSS